MKEIMCNYLTKRGNTYYFRRKSPLDLIHIYGKEIIFSLNTKDRKAAETLTRKKAVEYDEAFAEARRSLSDSPSPSAAIHDAIQLTKKPLEPIDINHAILRRVGTLRAAREREMALGKGQLWVQTIRAQLDMNNEFLRDGEHPLFKINPSVIEAEIFIHAANHVLDGVALPFMQMVMPVNTASAPAKEKSIYLDDVAKKWDAETPHNQRTFKHYVRHIPYFEKAVGKLSVKEITKKHFIEYKDTRLAKGDSPLSINRSIEILRIFLNFAISMDVISINPADKVKILVKNNPKDARLPFDINSLNIIFNSQIYSSKLRPAGGKGEAAYWIPLIALFTGARQGEICQLMKRDIKNEKYFDNDKTEKFAWMFDITDMGERQKLKNQGSRRKIPVHSTLIKLGFIEYVQRQADGMIFPLLLESKEFKEIGSNWSKWFGRFLRVNLKITDKKLVFHSFRHTFKEYCRNAGIATEVHHALTGHSMGNVGDNYGGIYYPIPPLVEAMNKYVIPNLKIGSVE